MPSTWPAVQSMKLPRRCGNVGFGHDSKFGCVYKKKWMREHDIDRPSGLAKKKAKAAA